MSMFGSAPRPGGMFGALANNSDAFLMAGMGLLGGRNPQQQFAGAMQGYGAGSQMDTARREKAEKDKLAADQKAALERVMANPAMKDMSPLAEIFPLYPELAVGSLIKRLEPKEPDYPTSYDEHLLAQKDPAYAASLQQGETPQDTNDMRNLERINKEREAAGMPPYRLDEWITLRAKAGAFQIPAEAGARIGLGDQFRLEAPGIRAAIEDGAATGMWDRAQLAAGVGPPMEVWRRMESGKEALVRQLTGAGMAQAEADNQASRYSINPWKDRKEDMLLKLEGLLRDLEATREGTIGARSGAYAPGAEDQPSGPPEPGTELDGYRFLGGDPADPNNWEPLQ